MAELNKEKEYLYEIITEYGNKRIVNGAHPFETAVKWSKASHHPIIKPYQWQTVETLQKWMVNPPIPERSKFTSDTIESTHLSKEHSILIAMPDAIPVFGDTYIDEREVTLLAYFIGDGGVTGSSPLFTQSDNEVRAEWMSHVKGLGGSFSCRELEGKANAYTCNGGVIKNLLKKHEVWGKDSYEKKIPECVYQLPKEQLALFINRLYSTDGWLCKTLSKKKGRTNSYRVELGYCSVSEELVRQLQRLLIRFGIHAKVREKKVSGVPNQPNYVAYTLDIHDSGQQLKFLDAIGIYGRPEQVEDIYPLIKKKSVSKQYPKWRYKKATEGTYWQKVKSIKRLEEKENTVAICVPGYETYITDFYEHNSYLAARLAIWFALCRSGIIFSTAPTKSQVVDILWKEIRDLIGKTPFLKNNLNYGRTFFRVDGSEIEASGFTARSYDLNSIQGRHAENLLFIVDEACGISEEIDQGIRSCLSGDGNRILRLGNPVEPQTPFEAACSLSSIVMPVWDHPNIKWAYEYCPKEETHILKDNVREAILTSERTGEVAPESEWPEEFPRSVIPGAVSIGWVEEQRKDPLGGPGSSSWTSRVEGLFPESAEDVVITKRIWDKARRTYDENWEYWDEIASAFDWRFGVDVADGGKDNSVISCWRGPVLYKMHKVPRHEDPAQDQTILKDYIYELVKEYGGRVQVDGIGVGSPLPGRLIEAGIYDAHKVIWSNREIEDPDTFMNQKAEDFHLFKRDLVYGDVVIAPLGKWEEVSKREMTDYRAKRQVTDKIIMEPKKEYKLRHRGQSPDFADSIIIGYTENITANLASGLQIALEYLV